MPSAPLPAEPSGPRGAPTAAAGRSPAGAWPIAVFLTLSGFVAFIWYFAISAHEAAVLQERNRELLAIAELKIAHLAEWVEERRRDARIVALSPVFAEALSGRPKTAGAQAAVTARLEEIRGAYDYEAVVLLNADAGLRAYAGDLHSTRGTQTAARAAMGRRDAVVADYYFDAPGHEHMDLDIAVPVYAADGDRVLGALVMHVNADRHVFSELQRWPSPSRTAEAMLVARVGGELVYLTPLRHREDFRLRRPVGEADLPAAMAARGRRGMAEGRDYRGQQVLAAIGQVPGTSWMMVAKVDRDEVLAPVRRQAVGSGVLALGLLAAMGLATRLWRRRQQAEFRIAEQESVERALRDSEHTLRTFLDAVPGGSALLKPDGTILVANAATARAVGVPVSTLAGRNIFDFLPAEVGVSRRPWLEQVVAEGRPMRFEDSSPGRSFEHHAVPIRNANGNTGSVAWVAIEITERKEAERKRLDFARQQRDTLVREVHHRIKNHLQGLAGLLRQHIFRHPALKQPLDAIIAQINAIAIVHGLQGREKTGEVRVAALVQEVVGFLGGLTAAPIEARIPPCAAACCLADEESIPVALILNELVTNALRHGRAKRGAGVHVLVGCDPQGAAITIENPGRCPAGLDFPAGRGLGTGLTLVRSLLPQSGTSLAIGPGREGWVEATLKLSPPVLIRSEQCPEAQASMSS